MPATSTTAASTTATSTRRPFDPFAFAFAIYSAGVLLLLVRLVAEEIAIRRFAARAIIAKGEESGKAAAVIPAGP